MADIRIERHPVHAEFIGGEIVSSGVAFEDYTRMSTQMLCKLNSNRRLVAPAWAYNDDQLLTVITRSMEERAMLWQRIQAGTNIEKLARAQQKLEKSRPELMARLDALCARFVAFKREGLHDEVSAYGIQVEALDTQLRLLSDMPKILAGTVYFYWRCGFDSVQTGQRLGIKPPHVRQLLCRMLESANVLGFAPPVAVVYEGRRGRRVRATSYSREGDPRVKALSAGPVAEIKRLHAAGRFTIDIARDLKLGADGCEIVNLVLIQAGLR